MYDLPFLKNVKRKEGESIRQWAKRIGVEHDQWLALYEKGRYEEKELSSEEKAELIEYSKLIEDQIKKIQKERR
ncbi:hypothetical protein Q73_04520 [Bacillus coahuilensis m2-6]|uniref:hypothetical protein n=1 Tax=Bacillus coahuilensis TaxID=408580 RepID=UPI0001850BE7|nr:hypothetical protein [Bacillus coahuilensis]KUP08914.1 hypothetical protein Q73_04520 [Bacillus coahuilensis m2-6]